MDVKITLVYFVLLLAQYVLIAKAAHNYGNRFVLNVICEEASSLLCRDSDTLVGTTKKLS